MQFTIDEKIACLSREIAMRERVYPRFVTQGRMRQDEADRETALMRAIRADLVECQSSTAEPQSIDPRPYGEPGERA